MISRKESLLIKPWQQRKFQNHRQKVKSALPAIDNRPPPYRGHVVIKLKKQQKDKERRKEIEKENFLLLQKMNYIMRTSRVDNTWRDPQPFFSNRIPLYEPVMPEIEDLIESIYDDNEEEPKSRKARCCACTPQKIKEPKIPEERIPWEPIKVQEKRVRSKSVPVKGSEPLPIIREKALKFLTPSNLPDQVRTNTAKRQILVKRFDTTEPQSIILSRGCLKLSMRFPSDSMVKYNEGNYEKVLLRGLCYCKNNPAEVF